MKSKKNVLVSLSIFIVFIFILTLFGQKPKIEDRVAALETKVAALETWKSTQKALGPPDYDSGWKTINRGRMLKLIHNLGDNPDYYIVDLQFKDRYLNRHTQFYGGAYRQVGSSLDRCGTYWQFLDDREISVMRSKYDQYVEWVRVRIWKY